MFVHLLGWAFVPRLVREFDRVGREHCELDARVV